MGDIPQRKKAREHPSLSARLPLSAMEACPTNAWQLEATLDQSHRSSRTHVITNEGKWQLGNAEIPAPPQVQDCWAASQVFICQGLCLTARSRQGPRQCNGATRQERKPGHICFQNLGQGLEGRWPRFIH